VISLVLALEIAFLWPIFYTKTSVVVSIEAFIGVLTFAMTWWFKSRDEEKARSALATTITTTTPGPGEPGPTKVTTTGPTPGGLHQDATG